MPRVCRSRPIFGSTKAHQSLREKLLHEFEVLAIEEEITEGLKRLLGEIES